MTAIDHTFALELIDLAGLQGLEPAVRKGIWKLHCAQTVLRCGLEGIFLENLQPWVDVPSLASSCPLDNWLVVFLLSFRALEWRLITRL